MKKAVPFYENPDRFHCYQVTLRMVLKYFLPKKEFSLKKLEKMTGFKTNKWTWPMVGLINLKRMGFDIVNMVDFDYERFANEAESYLIERFGKDVGREQFIHSDVPQVFFDAREFVRLFGNQTIIPNTHHIKKLLTKGYLIVCNVNGKILTDEKGYEGHFVLISDFDEDNFYLQNSGPPPIKNAKIPFILFNQAWAYPTQSEKNLMAFKYP